MNKTIIIAITIATVLGAAIGGGITYALLQPILQNMQGRMVDLVNKIEALREAVDVIKRDVAVLNESMTESKTGFIGIEYRRGIGNYLVDGNGRTLYYFARDLPGSGRSEGVGSTAQRWRPFYTENLRSASGLNRSDFGSIARPDGTKQTTFRGWPLYYFIDDAGPGETRGHGFNNLWYAVPPSYSIEQSFTVEVAFPKLSFDRPVGIYSPGDGSSRLFVLEQEGMIRVFEKSRADEAAVFLDIRDRVNSEGIEEGLLGLAFHPNFSSNKYFYLYYSAANPRRSVVARYTVAQGNPNQADKRSERILLEIPQPRDNHNGGQMAFGPDGYLYIALGDGGGSGDPFGNGQNRSTLLGKILRIDVDARSEKTIYGSPRDNPFVNNISGYREEIYAYGLRNPWRFSFDPVTGWLWAADVGQNRAEEIDIIEKGRNYGWNIIEGNHCFSSPQNCDQTGLEPPIWTYGRDQGSSITGGFVYRGSELPELIGWYSYGDFEKGRIWALRYDGYNKPVNVKLLDTDLHISSFGIDEENELYICAFDGKIYKLKAIGSSRDR